MNKVAFATLTTLEIYNFPENPYKKVEIFLPNNECIVHEFGRFKTFDPQVIEIPTPIDLTQEKANYYLIKSLSNHDNNEVKEIKVKEIVKVKLIETKCNQNRIISYVLYRDDLKEFDTVTIKPFMKFCYFLEDCQIKLRINFNKENVTEKLERSRQ